VLAHETGVADVADPLAGSYFIESLTNQIESAAEDYLQRIDAMGGMLRAIESGFVQREIQQAAYEYQRAVEEEQAVVVGVNRFRMEEETPVPVLRIDEEIERSQIARLRALRQRRDSGRARAALDRLAETAASSGNLMPAILEAVESWCTIGEICDTLRTQFGEYQESVVV
jgi:methylmalonyl-CoA mutase N-terminal domain/subunit